MFDNGRHICRLAADMVRATRAYAGAAKAGADTSDIRAALEARLLRLAEELYATEELFAMEASFPQAGNAGAAREQREALPVGANGVIYRRIAEFIASLVPAAQAPAELPEMAAATGPILGKRLSLLSHALSKAGYVAPCAELQAGSAAG